MRHRKIVTLNLAFQLLCFLFILFYTQVASTMFIDKNTNLMSGIFSGGYKWITIVFEILILFLNIVLGIYGYSLYKTRKYFGIYQSIAETIVKICLVNLLIFIPLFILFISYTNLSSRAIISWIFLATTACVLYQNTRFTYKLWIM